MKSIYQHSPEIAAEVASLSPIQKGSRAAKSLARQRAFLMRARKSIKSKAMNLARYYLALWAEERKVWAHLVGEAKA